MAKKSASMGESGYNGRSDDCHTPREIQTVYRSTKEFLNKRARCVHQAVKLNLQSTVLAEIDHDPVIFFENLLQNASVVLCQIVLEYHDGVFHLWAILKLM